MPVWPGTRSRPIGNAHDELIVSAPRPIRQDLLTDLQARHPELLLFSLVCAGLRGAKRSANKGNCRTRLSLYRGRGTHRKGAG